MKELFLKEPPIIYGFMMYECEKCGTKFRMAMEIGVEDHGEHGRPHQPCPFVIHIERFRNSFPALPKTRFFAYDHSGRKDACGIPAIYMGQQKGMMK